MPHAKPHLRAKPAWPPGEKCLYSGKIKYLLVYKTFLRADQHTIHNVATLPVDNPRACSIQNVSFENEILDSTSPIGDLPEKLN